MILLLLQSPCSGGRRLKRVVVADLGSQCQVTSGCAGVEYLDCVFLFLISDDLSSSCFCRYSGIWDLWYWGSCHCWWPCWGISGWDSTLEFSDNIFHLNLQLHVFLLKVVIQPIDLGCLWVCNWEYFLREQPFHFQNKFVFQRRDLFCHGQFYSFIQQAFEQYDYVLSMCWESSIVLRIELMSGASEWSRARESILFKNLVRRVEDSSYTAHMSWLEVTCLWWKGE